jgi:ribonuclease HI
MDSEFQRKILVWTDGGSRGNPGPAAIGVVFKDTKIGEKEYSQYIGEATNNVAEYKAVIFALKKLKALVGKEAAKKAKVEVRLDSELVGKQLEGRYKILEKDLWPLFIEVFNLRQDFGEVSFKIIPRQENKKADYLVNLELNRQMSTLPNL